MQIQTFTVELNFFAVQKFFRDESKTSCIFFNRKLQKQQCCHLHKQNEILYCKCIRFSLEKNTVYNNFRKNTIFELN